MMRMPPCSALLTFVTAFLLSGSIVVAADVPANSSGPPVNFQRQVRPILSDNCFLCHGPDKGTRMADVRLDIKEGAFATRKNGTIIVPGKPDESLLIKRISSDNPGFRMPPPFAHKTLTAAQIDTLRRWVEQGAQWTEHWAFIAPVKPAVPAVKDASWVRNPIDNFILANLDAHQLKPAPEADRQTLIRRVTLDLTGLPPTPEEVEAFVADHSDNAYDKVVDRLLASPHYGEQMGHYWLDAARYADTQGLHIDNYREMWPYRDWVINAFNRNMRFDEFTIEQLAGDLLPHATLDQKIASGFQRCNVTTNEGGSIPAEVEAMYARDRADTTGTVWMGLTVGCATCHDHKFDPIAQKEMYAMTAFFRNTTQYALDGNVPNTPPVVTVPPAADRQKWEQLQTQRATLEAQLAQTRTGPNAAFESWLRSPERRKIEPLFASSELLKLNLSDNAGALRKGTVEGVTIPDGVSVSEGPIRDVKALSFQKETGVKLPNVPEIDTDKPFTIATWIKIPKLKESYSIASQMESKQEGKSSKEWGWSTRVTSSNSEPSMPEIMLQGNDGKYISAQPAPEYGLKANVWYHVIFTYDGSRSERGLRIFINGDRVPSYGTGEDLAPLESSIRTTTAPLYLGNKDKQFFEGGGLAGFRILDRQLDEQDARLLFAADAIEAAKAKDIADLSETDRQNLLTYFVSEVDSSTKAISAQLHEVDAQRYGIIGQSATTLVQQERTDTQPVAHVLYRGLYDQMREEVRPNVPAVLPPMAQSLPRNRLGLAKWLMDPANPLTARVTVNRFWQHLFGTGIVKTSEDFGSQGEPPSNQQLLDWLAVEFRESNWDVKKTIRLMVTSATYRQSAEATPDKLEHDRDNRLLSRGPRFRMDAEMLRDSALFASGLLVPKIGGPSVKPYQPAKVWETVAMDNSNTRFYKADTGEGLYRRSLYTFWKRSAPPPSMDIFDAPSREECVARRERTDTPLQALVTMNDPQFVEADRVLAQNALLASPKSADEAVDYISSRLLARTFSVKERAVILGSYHDYLAYYQSDPADAKKLITVGESKPADGLAPPKLAAMTMVANELMNLDEVLVK
jgi:hypothetical protein